MLDTVRFRVQNGQWLTGGAPVCWSEKAVQGVELPAGGDEIEQAAAESYFKRLFQHEASGMRLYGDQYEAHTLEVSLPRMLYGCNGRELRPEDAEGASSLLWSYLHGICPAATLPELTRCDLVKNFRGDPAKWVAMHRGIRHPRIRNSTHEWFGTGLTWPGSRIYVNLYDKRLELEGVPGDVMRLEFQLRSRETPRDVWNGRTFDVRRAYDRYRELACGFEPRPFVCVNTLGEFLAWLDKAGVLVDGLRPLEVYLSGRKRWARWKVRRQIEGIAALRKERVVYSELLPSQGWPEWVDCVPAEEAVANVA